MHKVHLYIVSIGLAMLICSPSSYSQTTIYVAPNGADNAPATIDKPIASLKEARNRVRNKRKINPNEQVHVVFKGGNYPTTESVEFWKLDSGSKQTPIIYRNVQGETPVFFGGTLLTHQDFKSLNREQHQSFIDKLVDQNSAEKIKVIDLKALGIDDFGKPSRQAWAIKTPNRTAPVSLTIGGQRMTLARWPNIGIESEYMTYQHYLDKPRALRGYEKKVQKIIEKFRLPGQVTYLSVPDVGDKARSNPDGNGGTMKVAFDRMKYWHDVENVFVDGVLASTWEWSYNQLQSVDVKNKTITLKYPELNGLGIGESVRLPHFYFDNIAEEIDSPGEYYIDRDSGLLYLYPPENFNTKDIVLNTLEKPMVKVENAAHITFKGLTFDSGRNLGVSINRSHHIIIKNSTVANFTAGGISIHGNNNIVANSHIYGMGAFGVHLNGGNKKTLFPANNVVINCHIHDFGWEQKSQQPGVMLEGVGQYLLQSKIYDGTHFAVRVRNANDIVIEGNEIFDLPKYHHFDGGALYVATGHLPESRGIEIRKNYFHDIPTHGVYPDNFSWGVKTYQNIFNNVGVAANRAAVFVNGGGENRTFNNIFIDTAWAYGQGTRPKDEFWLQKWKGTLQKYGDGKVLKTAYRKYPDFIEWLEKKEPEEFYRPESFVYDNIVYNSKVDLLSEPKANNGIVDKSKHLSVADNIAISEDPGFVDAENGNFQLKQDAEILKKLPNFQVIDFNKIGLNKW